MKKTACFAIGMTIGSSLIFGGCQKAGEKVAEKAIEAGMAKEGSKANVDISGDKITVKSKDGTVEYTGGKDAVVPENLPKDVYVYDGAKIITSVSAPEGVNLIMETSDSADKVLGTIKSKMSGFGWKEEITMNQGNHFMVSYKKGERAAVVNINADKKSTQINLTATEQKGSKSAKK